MAQGKYEDLTGARFYKLTVLHRAADYIQPSGQHKRMWHCRCECGNECDVRAADLKSGNTRSCGCFQQYSRGKSSFEDLTGEMFGRLTVMYRLPDHVTPSGQKQRKWHCKCECGNECDVYATQLKNGKKSCGCISLKERAQREIAKNIAKEKSQKEKQIARNKILCIVEGDALDSCDDKTKELVKKYLQDEQRKAEKKEKKKAEVKRIKQVRRKDYLHENSLAVKCPDLISEWNFDKNSNTPQDVSVGSNEKVWWKCSKGHEWQANVNSRARGNGCPYCSNRLILVGFNDLATTNPDLLSEWDYDSNTISPTEVKAGSSEIVWWKCSTGHSYDMRISSRTGRQKCGCPYCSVPAKRVLKGFNDLQTRYPEIAKEWHPTKNAALMPNDVLCGSAKKVWWRGRCGHEYEQSIVNRVNGGNCPYCSHQKLLVGFSDFASTNPEMLAEWDYDKNDVLPSEIGVGTHRKVWWKCPFGHSYQAYPSSRCGSLHSGCPICDKENHTSFPEQALFFYTKKFHPDAINSDRVAIGMELDIYIPSLKIAIEYDGKNWHGNNKHELKKNKACKDNNILLMRIREEGLEIFDDCYCIVRMNVRSNDSLSEVIRKVLYDIDSISDVDVDVERDSAMIYSSYVMTRKSQSLNNTYPNIAKEWHPTKNGELTADMVAPMTNKKIWWLGECGHEWLMSVQIRTYHNCGCPICSGKRIVSGINDLLTKYPRVCDEWFYEKNSEIGLFPDNVAPHSDKKAWWKCSTCGFIWKSKIDSRTRMKAGCPECGKRIIVEAKNKPVICVETGVVYGSLKEANDKTGISTNGIGNCCKGKQKTAGKLHWKYSEEKEK